MKKQIVLLFHLGYWSFYVAMMVILFVAAQVGHYTAQYFSYFLGVGIAFVLTPSILGFYASYFVLFKRYLQRRNMLLLLGYGLVVICAIILITATVISLFFGSDFMFKNGYNSFYSEILLIALIGMINGVIGFVLKGFITWFSDLKIKEALKQHTSAMELELIKSKLDPHFLFNTINNIDGLMMSDVNRASLYLDKLSSVLRFVLYESKAQKIPLSKELEYIQKYIDLQKIRTTNTNFVEYTVEGSHFKHQIAAMLFIPFIENAFKHVASRKGLFPIKIHIATTPQKIVFSCKNSFKPSRKSPEEIGGIGNELIKKRLQLLYPNQHQLKISIADEIYSVQLTILTHED